MDAQAASALFGLARVQGATDELREAWTSAARAFDYFLEAGDAAQAVAVAEYPFFFTPGVRDITRLTTQALDLVPPDSVDSGRLLSRYGLLHNLSTGDYEGARDALTRALEIAQKEGDQRLEMQALANAADVAHYHLKRDEVVAKGQRVIGLARELNDPHAEVWPRWLVLFALVASGVPEGQAENAAELMKVAERTRNQGLLANALSMTAAVAHAHGRFEEGLNLSHRGLTMSGHYGFASRIAIAEYEVGAFEEANSFLQRVVEATRDISPGPSGEYAIVPMVVGLAARITGVARHFDAAERAAEVVVSAPSAVPLIADTARTGQALMAVYREDSAAAGQLYERLRHVQGGMVLNMVGGDWVLGLVSRTMGETDRAVGHFQDAIAFSRHADYRPHLAWACYDCAETLLLRGGPTDGEQAGPLIDEGLTIASDLGMAPLEERLTALGERIESRLALAPRYPDGLTEREVEVLRLVAAGRASLGRERVRTGGSEHHAAHRFPIRRRGR